MLRTYNVIKGFESEPFNLGFSTLISSMRFQYFTTLLLIRTVMLMMQTGFYSGDKVKLVCGNKNILRM